MGDFVTSLVMVVFLFAGGTVISAEGQNATDNYLQEILDGTQLQPTMGPKNDVSATFKSLYGHLILLLNRTLFRLNSQFICI